ncbi:MAG: hypothetical protein H0V44_01830 [Planctomycetes bacterium]|nr:hypothetical protein [Planctomycetota bacterium]
MPPPPHRPRRWLFPLAVLVIAVLSLWALKRMPAPTLVGHARVASGVTLTASNPGVTTAWTMHLRLDPAAKPPGPRWILHEGKQVGEGYELHWLPEKLGLQVFRAPDRLLLGTTRLERMPRTVEFVRRGAWLVVRCDGTPRLSCLDPIGAAEPVRAGGDDPMQAWGCSTIGSMGDSALTLADDQPLRRTEPGEDPLPVEDDPRESIALARVRDAMLIDATKCPPSEVETVFGAASQALSELPTGSVLQLRLRHWLALSEIQLALARPDELASAERASDAIDQLVMLCQSAAVPETTGILMSLFPRLAYNASFRPAYPESPRQVLANRSLWMRVLGAAAVAARASANPAIGDDLQYQIGLLIHACGCLQSRATGEAKSPTEAGGPRAAVPQPSPAEAPPWLSSRWRAFAGGDPEVANFPEMPGSRSDPVVIAIERLAQGAVLEPVAAVSMRYRIDRILKQVARALRDQQNLRSREEIARATQEALAALDGVPARESALAASLVALQNLGSKEAAFEKLMVKDDRGLPWIHRDPLAFAIASLMLARNPQLKDLVSEKWRAKEADLPGSILAFPDKLRPFEHLLSGKPETTDEIWLHDPAVLPPAQALATALAMQEAKPEMGARPEWTLLRRVPCFTLPLDLLIPAENERVPTAGDDIRTPAPVMP